MSAPIVGSNIRLEVSATYGSPVTVQSVSLGNPGVVGATGHGFNNGDVVVFAVTSGMAQLDGQVGRVSAKTTDTFEIEGLNTTAFDAFTAGTVKKVATWLTFDKAQSVSAPNPPPTRIDVSTLLDVETQEVFGRSGASQGTVGALFNPGGATEAALQAATAAKTAMVFRITYADSRKTLVNSYVSGGFGFELANNDAAKASVEFAPIRKMQHYAS